MINELFQWFNIYPSRKYALIGYVLLIIYALFITHIKINIANKQKRNKRFIYCNGKKSQIEYVEMVTQHEFDNCYRLVPHPIIDMNNTSVYFDRNVLCDEYYDL